MLKELTVKEALQLLAEKYPEAVEGWFWDDDEKNSFLSDFIGIEESKTQFVAKDSDSYLHFSIEIPDEYRCMTQQECFDWVCLHGYKGHQVKFKCDRDWAYPNDFYFDFPPEHHYRTIKEIDGKIVYGEPQEFKVKVQPCQT